MGADLSALRRDAEQMEADLGAHAAAAVGHGGAAAGVNTPPYRAVPDQPPDQAATPAGVVPPPARVAAYPHPAGAATPAEAVADIAGPAPEQPGWEPDEPGDPSLPEFLGSTSESPGF